MGEYDSGPRQLPWPLLHPLVGSRTVEDDEVFPPSSFVWPTDPDERTVVPFWLSLNEYNVLGSTIDVGSDVAFAEDALRVMWLWMRNMRVQVPICDAVDACITDNPATIAAIVAQLIVNTTYNTYLTTVIESTPAPPSGNVYPPRPTAATPTPLCNAATYLVGKLKEVIMQIYDDLETLTPQEILEAFLGIFGWRSGPLYQLIGLLETAEPDDLLAAFDEATPDLICQLIDSELDQAPVLAWVATEFPPPSVLGDALTMGIGALASEGKYAQWIAVGATMTGADCSGCIEPVTPIITFIGTPGVSGFDGTPKTFIGNTPAGGSIWDLTFHSGSGVNAVAVTAQIAGEPVCVNVLDTDNVESYQHLLCGGGGAAGVIEDPTTNYGPDLGWFGLTAGTVMRVTVKPA